jgi:hypothetical protein
MKIPKTITCDRCKSTVDGILDDSFKSIIMTAGYYVVSTGYWKGYGNAGEVNICDKCMFADPRYIKRYGDLRIKKS